MLRLCAEHGGINLPNKLVSEKEKKAIHVHLFDRLHGLPLGQLGVDGRHSRLGLGNKAEKKHMITYSACLLRQTENLAS